MFCRGNVDEKHDKWFIEAENFVTAIDMDIDVKKPSYASRQKNRDNYLTTTVSEYYKLSLTIPLLDTIISEFESRFSKEHRIHGNGFFNVPSHVIK